jgi:hypothetical protein
MEEIKFDQKRESINGIVAELGIAVHDTPEVFGNKLQEVQMVLQDWEDSLAGNHGLEVDQVEEHLRDLHKLLKPSN